MSGLLPPLVAPGFASSLPSSPHRGLALPSSTTPTTIIYMDGTQISIHPLLPIYTRPRSPRPHRRRSPRRSRPCLHPARHGTATVGGGKVAEPRGRVELSPTAVADQGRASSKKRSRRQKKASMAAAAAAAEAVAAPSPSPAMQRLFDTSREVFADSSPGFVPPPDAVARLSGLLNDLKPRDVAIDSSMSHFKHVDSRGPPRVTYLHFYDCSKFSFGIFCLPKSAVIPLHNHPGMTVFSKILFGSMHLKSYDWARSSPNSNDDNTLETSDGARLAKVNTDAVFDASAETVVLYPENGGNLHCFTALTPCAVLDVMGPPYNRADGRDCMYYSESPYSSSCGGDEQFSWLKEIPSTFEMKGIQMERKFNV